jgi:hypothetical protein
MTPGQRKGKALYFCKGMVPTAEEFAEAGELRITAFRNASSVSDDAALEKADVVAGAVPVRYVEMKDCRILEAKKPQQPQGKGGK